MKIRTHITVYLEGENWPYPRPEVSESIFAKIAQEFPQHIEYRNEFRYTGIEGESELERIYKFFDQLGLIKQSYSQELNCDVKILQNRLYEEEELDRFDWWKPYSHNFLCEAVDDFFDTWNATGKKPGWFTPSRKKIGSVGSCYSSLVAELSVAERISATPMKGVDWKPINGVVERELYGLTSSLPPCDIINDTIDSYGELKRYDEARPSGSCWPLDGCFGIPEPLIRLDSLEPDGDVFISNQRFSLSKFSPTPQIVVSNKFKQTLEKLRQPISWFPVRIE